jgi:hypothetical protein
MIELELGNGMRIDDCFEKVVRFCHPESGPDFCKKYDCASVEQDNTLRDSPPLL